MSNEEKKMTKYERKLEARKQQEAQEKKSRMQGRLIAAAVALVIVAAVLYTVIAGSMEKKAAMTETYITVGEHEITRAAYDYYYYDMVNQYLTMYSSWIPYLGLDTSKDFAEQQYDETRTWKDAFDQMAVEQIQQVKALMDKAEAEGWDYDTTADYEDFLDQLEEGAKNMGVDVDYYLEGVYGEYAELDYIKPLVEESIKAAVYGDELYEDFRPTEDEIDAYYEENKADYDLVDYYQAIFKAEVAEDATEEERKAAMDEQKALAEEMKSRLDAGEDFETVCAEYFPEEVKEDNETPHLKKGYSSFSMMDTYSEWMLDESRTKGDSLVAEYADSDRYYVVQFVERNYDENCEEDISDELATEAMTEYLDTLMPSYEVVDTNGVLNYLTLPETTIEE